MFQTISRLRAALNIYMISIHVSALVHFSSFYTLVSDVFASALKRDFVQLPLLVKYHSSVLDYTMVQ